MKIFKLPTLYSVAKIGRKKQWTTGVLFKENSFYTFTEYGYVDGKIRCDKKLIKSGKNIGRSNETVVYQQAINESISLWNKAFDKGYDYIAQELSPEEVMLAKVYRSDKAKWPGYGQPKLDGVRCKVFCSSSKNHTIDFVSRNGKRYQFLNHIARELLPSINDLTRVYGKPYLDGEIYKHGMKFEDIISGVRQEKESNDITSKLEYHIYDVYFPDRPEMLFEERIHVLDDWIRETDSVKIVSTYECTNEDDFKDLASELIGVGYEGVMYRDPSSSYLLRYRSDGLMKYKEFMQDEFRIVGGREGTGKDAGKCIFECITDGNVEFSVRTRGSDDERRAQLSNLNMYKNKYLTVNFQGYGCNGAPRFPVGITLRDYE